jgi:outer membrane protein OmpA-like peptidoglycan-associated protein
MKAILLTTAAMFAVGCASTQPQQTTQQSRSSDQQSAQQSSWTGERGPDGPAGARGAQGEVGQTGPAGYAVAGERGPAGPAGPAGERGAAGARGQAGELVRGPTGEAGAAGATGAQGQAGQTGARGASAEGVAGPAGPAGPTGPVGAAGAAGERGEQLVGPTGAAGRTGSAGERGEPGQAGSRGGTTAGVAGAAGVAGQVGPRGEIGPMGPVGPTGLVENWTAYREFWFDPNMTQVHDADRYQFAEIASYMRANPTLQVGIDNWSASGTSQSVRESRFNGIRSSLVSAGVPSTNIMMGAFSNANQRRDGRVGVLLRTDRDAYAQAPSRSASAGSSNQSDRPTQSAVTENWSTLQSFWFDADTATMHTADTSKVTEIAAYMKSNPSLQIGIDSTLQADNPDHQRFDRDLASNRGEAVKKALVEAGVPASRISSGAYGDNRLRRDGRVEVLVRTERLSLAR